MRILITGAREWQDASFIWKVLDQYRATVGHKLTIIQGGCRGADQAAKVYCDKYKVDCITCWAHWGALGKAAGPIRNHYMLDEFKPDLVIAFHENLFGGSTGTLDMFKYAKEKGVNVMYFTGKEKL